LRKCLPISRTRRQPSRFSRALSKACGVEHRREYTDCELRAALYALLKTGKEGKLGKSAIADKYGVCRTALKKHASQVRTFCESCNLPTDDETLQLEADSLSSSSTAYALPISDERLKEILENWEFTTSGPTPFFGAAESPSRGERRSRRRGRAGRG